VNQAELDRAIARIPRWMAALGLLGGGIAGRIGGASYAGAFLVGAAAAWLNFRLIERTVNRLGRLASATSAKPAGKGTGAWMFIQFAVLVLGAFVILGYSGFSLAAAVFGFLVCPAAAIAELVYELLTYGHS
jgi:hypothetical protein